MKKYLYRYVDDVEYPIYEAIFRCHRYEITKITPRGFWINYFPKDKWVSNYGTNRFAWPTEKEALFNYMKRKEMEVKILTRRLKDAVERHTSAKIKYEGENK